MLSLVVMVFAALALGRFVHGVGHYVTLGLRRPASFTFSLCPRGAVPINYFQGLQKYDKVVSLAAGAYAEFGFGLVLCTIGIWFSPDGSLVWSCVLLLATAAWWARPRGSQGLFIVAAPWLLAILTAVGFFVLAWGTSDSFFDNLLCTGFAPMLSAVASAMPFECLPNSDGTRIAKTIQCTEE